MSAVRILVADDSRFVRRLLAGYLGAHPGFEVVATAGDGHEAVAAVRRERPDVVTLDLEMPGMDGLAALDEIMRTQPTPVVVVSGVSGRSARRTLSAIERGAVDFVVKFAPGSPVDPGALRAEIVAKVETAARIRVIRSLASRWPADSSGQRTLPGATGAGAPAGPLGAGVVVIGASTGGPMALRELLGALPADFAQPVVVVQHLPAGFSRVLAAQLDRQGPLAVREARDGDRLQPGTVFVAPGGRHLFLTADGRLRLALGPAVGGHCPSIDVTLQSATQSFGGGAAGVLLTGMGEDGAAGLAAVRSRGGRTYVQDAATCVVNGMPQRAIERGAAGAVAPPRQIAKLLALAQPRSTGTPPRHRPMPRFPERMEAGRREAC